MQRLGAVAGVTASARQVAGDTAQQLQLRRLERLLRLEQLLYGLTPGVLEFQNIAATAAADASLPAEDDPSIVFDLTARPAPGHWVVLYDGVPGEAGAVAALRAGRIPVVSVVDDSGIVRAQGRPGSESPGLLTTALADITAGVSTLIVGATTGGRFAPPTDSNLGAAITAAPKSHLELAARRVVGSLVYRAYRALYRAPHWRVGWRAPKHAAALSDIVANPGVWTDLADDGFHFYADPFPITHAGVTYLFVEDFDHRVGRAVISVVEWGPDGAIGAPRPVLQHEVHLSYPFVTAHDGDMWLIPESSGARTLELFRAVEFPWKWERHSVLLDNIEISDATPFKHEGRWWLTGTVGYGGSLSDSLCIWSAPDLRGPWTPHQQNPVLIDIASARPAGRVELHDGRLLRPVQDGREGYGAALGVAEITRLDDEGFEQRIVAHHTAGKTWGGTRLHTLNRADHLETVDGSRRVPKFKPRRASDPGPSMFVVAREDDLDFRGDEYSHLFDRSTGSAFQHGVWIHRVYEQLAPASRARPCIITLRATEDGRLVGVLPFVMRRRGAARIIEFADLGVSDYAVPVIDREEVLAIRHETHLGVQIRDALGAFDLLLVERSPESTVPLSTLLHGARTRAHIYGAHPTRLTADVESWRARLGARQVRHLDKAYKRLRAKGGYSFRSVTDLGELDLLLAQLRDFRSARFVERGGLDLFQDPRFFDFYRTVARDSIDGRGPVTVRVFEVGGQPAAIALDLLEPDRELYVITGYDFGGLRNYSLGLLIVDQIARAAIERGVSVLDMTVGDEPYKASFGAERRPVYQVYVARTPLGEATFGLRQLYLWARRTAKRVRGAWRARRKRALTQKTTARSDSATG
ncbi:GNAT family N-acetyltransferase [Leucobacter sp. HY1910]